MYVQQQQFYRRVARSKRTGSSGMNNDKDTAYSSRGKKDQLRMEVVKYSSSLPSTEKSANLSARCS